MILRPAERKKRLTMWVDADVLDWFQRQARGYHTRLNAVLRAYYEAARRSK
jgi:uncharacterized protein (DUF4415 family)